MPIPITCIGCQVKLKAPDTAAGKKIKCPKCQTVISVPAADFGGDGAKNGAGHDSLAARPKADHWFLQTPDGSQYGPVPREEMDQWFSEGRVAADCQLLKSGETQWQWASAVYPALSQLAGAAAATSSGPNSGLPANSAAAVSPLTPLGSPSQFTDLPGLSPLDSPAASSTATLPSFTSGAAPSYSPLASPGRSVNPYAAPATAGAQRSGPHPLVIVAGIFQILFACWNFLYFIVAIVVGLFLLGGGVALGAAGAQANDPDAQGAFGAIAALGAIGAVVAVIMGLGFLVYGILQVSTAVGLFKRKKWAKVASLVYAGFGIVLLLWYLLFALTLDPVSIVSFVAELAFVVVLFIAMCMPDVTRDFR